MHSAQLQARIVQTEITYNVLNRMLNPTICIVYLSLLGWMNSR